MFGADVERFETEDGVAFRISWYDGEEHREKWVTYTREQLEAERDENDTQR